MSSKELPDQAIEQFGDRAKWERFIQIAGKMPALRVLDYHTCYVLTAVAVLSQQFWGFFYSLFSFFLKPI